MWMVPLGSSEAWRNLVGAEVAVTYVLSTRGGPSITPCMVLSSQSSPDWVSYYRAGCPHGFFHRACSVQHVPPLRTCFPGLVRTAKQLTRGSDKG